MQCNSLNGFMCGIDTQFCRLTKETGLNICYFKIMQLYYEQANDMV